MAGLESGSASVRMQAVLDQRGKEFGIERLERLLNDPSDRVREVVVGVLGEEVRRRVGGWEGEERLFERVTELVDVRGEPCEEVRLASVDLYGQLIVRRGKRNGKGIDGIGLVKWLRIACRDEFPSVIEASLQVLETVVVEMKEQNSGDSIDPGFRLYLTDLCTILLGTVHHRRWKTREIAVSCLAKVAVLSLKSTLFVYEDENWNKLSVVVLHDPSPKVRSAAGKTIVALTRYLVDQPATNSEIQNALAKSIFSLFHLCNDAPAGMQTAKRMKEKTENLPHQHHLSRRNGLKVFVRLSCQQGDRRVFWRLSSRRKMVRLSISLFAGRSMELFDSSLMVSL